MKKEKNAAAPSDPIAARIKAKRLAMGLSLAELAKRTGVRSPSHIHYIENGRKRPSEDVAIRIAEALDEDPEIFRAWALTKPGTDLTETLRMITTSTTDTARAIQTIIEEPRHKVAVVAPHERDRKRALQEIAAEARSGRLYTGPSVVIPVLSEGEDPDEGHDVAMAIDADAYAADVGRRSRRYAFFDRATINATPAFAQAIQELNNPFAYELSQTSVRHARELLPAAHLAIISRDVSPIESHEVYAVRIGGRIELARLRWNGRQLLVLPADDDENFDVFDAADEDELTQVVVGKVVVLVPSGMVRIRRG